MAKNLVIVESPAKARTIERYLGADYRVLASYGHVRDLPENPGKDKLGVDVEHDFAPDYEIVEDRTQAGRGDREGRASAADEVYLATDLDREGEAIAWHVAEAARRPRGKTRRVTFSEITQGAIQDAFAHPRDIDLDLVDAQQTRRILDRLVGYTLSPLLWRKVRGGPVAPAASSRSPSASSSSASGRSARSRRREYWTLEALLATAAGRAVHAPSSSGSTARQLDIGDERDRRSSHADALRAAAARSSTSHREQAVEAQPGAAVHDRTLQQEASRKLGFSPKRTMRVAQRLYEGVETPDGPRRPHHLHANRLGRAGRRGDGRGARGRSRDALRRPRTRCPRAACTRRRARTPRRRTRRSGRRRSRAIRTRLRAQLKRDELRLYRLIWQRAIASQMARQGARDDDRRAGGRPVRAARQRDADAVRRLLARLHRGPRRRRRGGRAHAAAARRGRRTTRRGRHADPALHRAAAALHRGDADQGARGARHRPAVDLRRDDLHDRRPRLRHGQGAAPPSRGGRRDRHRPPGRALRRVRRPRVHGAGWRRTSTRSPTASASGCRCCATFYTPFKTARRREAQAS